MYNPKDQGPGALGSGDPGPWGTQTLQAWMNNPKDQGPGALGPGDPGPWGTQTL